MCVSVRCAHLIVAAFLTACAAVGHDPQVKTKTGIDEVRARPILFESYPHERSTYLSFSHGHGFQVNYIGETGRAWLWYPGNKISLPEEYRFEIVGGIDALCWRHPGNSYNPVTKQQGGDFACQPLDFSKKTIVAMLPGDHFDLATGRVPHQLKRCVAPDDFVFNRNRFRC